MLTVILFVYYDLLFAFIYNIYNKYSMSYKFNLKNTNVSTSIFFRKMSKYSDNIDDIKIILENETDYDVFPNDENPENYYKFVTEYVYRLITNSEFLCKNLNENYIKNAFERTDAIVVIGTKGIDIYPNGNVFGFALINFQDDNSVYIDVICSHLGVKYAGDFLIKSIDNICKKLFITRIKLKSVTDAISFYERYGFVKIRVCDNNKELCEMVKIVPPKSKSKSKSKLKSKSSKSKSSKSKSSKSKYKTQKRKK